MKLTPREKTRARGYCTGPHDGGPSPGEVGADYMAACRTCGKRVRVTVRGLYAHHKQLGTAGKRKTFTPGETVEVKRESDYHFTIPWEPATYRERYADDVMRGWHSVDLLEGKERRIDSMTGMECGEDNPHSFLTRHLSVPSLRIRKSVAK